MLHNLLKGIHADMLADEFEAANAIIELDLAHRAYALAILASPIKKFLDLNALHKTLTPNQRPPLNRQKFTVVIVQISDIRRRFRSKSRKHPGGINLGFLRSIRTRRIYCGLDMSFSEELRRLISSRFHAVSRTNSRLRSVQVDKVFIDKSRLFRSEIGHALRYGRRMVGMNK